MVKARLGDLVKIRTGKLDANVASENGRYPFFTCAIQPLRINSYSYDCECVLVAGNGDLNVKYYNGKFDAYQRTYIIESNDHDILKCKYLYLFMNFYIDKLRKDSIGGVIKYIKLGNLTEAVLELPDIKKQQELIDKFDLLTTLIVLRKQQLSKLDQLVKSRFIEMFGECKTNPKNWKLLNMEDIAVVGSSKRVFVEELQEDGIPFYRGTEVGALAEGKSIVPELYIAENHYKELVKATGIPQLGDLLMPSICPDGRIWVVNTENPFYFKDGRVLWIHNIDTKFNSTFLLYTLKDRIMTDYLSIASGTTFSELKIFTLKKCKIFSVPLPLQEQFAAFVEQVEKAKSSVKQSLEKLETLKKALMQEYFG